VPIVLLGAAEDTQVLFKHLIGSFACSIHLRVVCCTDVLFDIKKAAEF